MNSESESNFSEQHDTFRHEAPETQTTEVYEPAIQTNEKSPEDLRQIEEARRKLDEIPLKTPNQNLIEVTKPSEGPQIRYVSKKELGALFGFASGNTATVRYDLSPRVKQFVLQHELYHLKDKSTWGGWLGREIRANFYPALKDPVGFAATVGASLTAERLKFYWQRIKSGF